MAPGLVARMVVGLLLAIAGAAAAARRPVAVIDLSASEPAARLAGELTTALNDHAELKPLDNAKLTAALQGSFEDEDAARLARARRFEQDAEDALAQLDDEAAKRSARAGMDELINVKPSSEMLGLYADLAFAFGQAQIGLRNPNDASRAFSLAHRLDPQRSPDPTRYQPNIIAAYSAAVNKPAPPAKLVVKGNGRVWIDGVDVGPAGATYDTIEGPHIVQLIGAERETRGQQANAPLGQPLEIPDAVATEEVKVRRARIELANARDAAERASAMRKLAGLLGVHDAVLIGKDGARLTVQTWRDREPGFSALMVHAQEEPIDLLRPLAPPRQLPDEPPPRQVPFNPPPVVHDTPWYNKNWIRASIAGGVIITVVGAILYTQRDKFLPPFNMDPTWKE